MLFSYEQHLVIIHANLYDLFCYDSWKVRNRRAKDTKYILICPISCTWHMSIDTLLSIFIAINIVNSTELIMPIIIIIIIVTIIVVPSHYDSIIFFYLQFLLVFIFIIIIIILIVIFIVSIMLITIIIICIIIPLLTIFLLYHHHENFEIVTV